MMGNGKVVYKLGIIIIYLENKENTIFLSFQEENNFYICNFRGKVTGCGGIGWI